MCGNLPVGSVSEWPKEAGCKPVGESLRGFESSPAHREPHGTRAASTALPHDPLVTRHGRSVVAHLVPDEHGSSQSSSTARGGRRRPRRPERGRHRTSSPDAAAARLREHHFRALRPLDGGRFRLPPADEPGRRSALGSREPSQLIHQVADLREHVVVPASERGPDHSLRDPHLAQAGRPGRHADPPWRRWRYWRASDARLQCRDQ